MTNGYEQLYTRTVGYVRSVKHVMNNIIVLLYNITLYTLFFSKKKKKTGEEKISGLTVLPCIITALRVSFIQAKSRAREMKKKNTRIHNIMYCVGEKCVHMVPVPIRSNG